MQSATGWLIATGSITFLNEIANRPDNELRIDYIKIPVATAVGVGLLSLVSKASPTLAVALAVGSFVTVAIAPLGGRPAPITTVLNIVNRLKIGS